MLTSVDSDDGNAALRELLDATKILHTVGAKHLGSYSTVLPTSVLVVDKKMVNDPAETGASISNKLAQPRHVRQRRHATQAIRERRGRTVVSQLVGAQTEVAAGTQQIDIQ